MPGQPAARIGDLIQCPVPQATPAALPHAPPPGLPIVPPGAPTVFIGGQLAARIGDKSICVAPAPAPNPIVKGAFPVPICNSPAARATDNGAHPGSTISPPCCTTVHIGLAGTSGNPWAGEKECVNLAAGRNPPPGALNPRGNQIQPNTPGQSYNNCGVESSRGIINRATNANIGQEALLNQAMSAGNAGSVPGNLFASGGTNTAQQVAILSQNGVPASSIRATTSAIQLAAAQGRGVIAAVDAGAPGYWPPGSAPPGSGHAVQVTGVEYDEDGNVVNYIINDTGSGECGKRVPAAVFQQAHDDWQAGGRWRHVATDNPIW